MNRFRVMTRKTEWGYEGAVLLDSTVCFRTGHQSTEFYALKLAREWEQNLIADIQESPVVLREVFG